MTLAHIQRRKEGKYSQMLKNATSGNSNKFHMQFNVRWAEKPAREPSKSLAGIGDIIYPSHL
jgi:hypothetical protein